ncbi:MAG TPA: carbohydrate binding family 9 domain-containing protein, partial [Longimicrobiales bacterium]|nr:carbohydrate binding family 9 domain-containing protein [Longimicrobiales bacterium]
MLAAVAILALLSQTSAYQAAPPPDSSSSTAVAHRADVEPVIDGRNDDAVWRDAPRTSGFRQWDPLGDSDPSYRTEFQVAYDERNLYVYVRAHDAHPDSIMRALSRRDVRGPSDQIVVFIDSYNDRRTGFEFAINPDGVKRDYAIYNDGDEDPSWNGVWYVATVVDSLGWAAEYRIPLSQLRYPDAVEHTFGFGVFRDIERYKERIAWPLFSRDVNGLSSQMGTLAGIRGISSSRSIEVTPYTVARSETRPAGAAGFEQAQKLTAGGDVKFRITPNVT